jgi:hypothetical protein
MLNLSQLKQALEPIKQLSLAEDSLTLSGVTIYVRILNPKQDFKVQSLSQQVLTDFSEDDAQADRTKILAYLDEFRALTLSMCIVQINDLDLREAAYIETGEKLENGTPIKITKEQALRDIVSEWNRPMQIAVLDCYNALVTKIEEETGTNIEGEFSDNQSELEYLRGRVQELERQNEQKVLEQTHNVQQRFRSVVESSKTVDNQDQIEDFAGKSLKKREQIFPDKAAPPQAQTIPQAPSPSSSSNTNPSQQEQESLVLPEESPEKEQEESVFFQDQEFPPAPKSVEKKDGIDVYRLPSQTLEAATVSPQKQPQKRAPIPSSRNPRFKPPQ